MLESPSRKPAAHTATPPVAVPAPEPSGEHLIGEFPLSEQPQWMLTYRLVLLGLDALMIVVATVAGFLLRFGVDDGNLPISYLWVGLGILAGWLLVLQYVGGYEIRHLATGPEQAKRVLRASGVTLSVVAIACYIMRTPVARGYIICVIPLGAALLLAERAGVRTWVARRRTSGRWLNRIVAVGTTGSVANLIATTERAKDAGLKIVGVCVEDAETGTEIVAGIPVLGGVLEAAEQAARVDADVIAVTDSGLGPTGVRELGWQLEGTGRGLVMAPALTEIAGTRMHISPVEGLPLVWLEQPRMGRIPMLVKRCTDVVGALAGLLLASPLLLATAVAIKVTSRGPVFFRQNRLGINGSEFPIVKFRSMYVDAEFRRAEIIELNEQDGGGVLFKMRNDPRVTRVGRWIRKFSIDELPQLVNVLAGTMSLVGPRPLATQDSIYSGSARRRLLVRPGITGLWQISGRSDLSWDDAVRLDLYYVENWSLGLDLSILARTVWAVVARKGAF